MTAPVPTRPTRLRGMPLIFAVLLGAAILLNVIQFSSIEDRAASGFAALERNRAGYMVTVVNDRCGGCQELFGLFFALRPIAPEAHVVVPLDQGYDLTRYRTEELGMKFRSYGGAATVEWVRFDSAAVTLAPAGPFDPAPYIIASGKGGRRGAPWAIAVSGGDESADHDDPDGYLTRTLSASGPSTPSTGAARRFVLLRWGQPRPNSDYDYQDLLVETSLLPGVAQAGLAG